MAGPHPTTTQRKEIRDDAPDAEAQRSREPAVPHAAAAPLTHNTKEPETTADGPGLRTNTRTEAPAKGDVQMSEKTLPQITPIIPSDNGQQSWIFTFGSGQQHDGRFVVIDGSHADARAEMLARFGNRWSFQYPIEDRADLEGRFGMVELPRKYWPEPAGEVAINPAAGAELAAKVQAEVGAAGVEQDAAPKNNYPVPREGRDLRWSFSVTNAVVEVLENRGYPEFTGLDRVELNTVLFGFLYGDGTGRAS